MSTEPLDSATEWVADHARKYGDRKWKTQTHELPPE